MKDYIAIIPARDGSKGLPNKNIKAFCGKPLYLWAVEQGVRVGAKSIVTTDIQGILTSGAEGNVVIHSRPSEFATDAASMVSVILDVIETYSLDSEDIILLQPTSPLRADEDILECIELHQSGKYDIVMSVVEVDNGCLKYGILDDGCFQALKDKSYPFANRQSLPKVYRPNGAVYVFNAGWFKKNRGFVSEKTGAYVASASRSLDIDDQEDFEAAQQIFVKN